MQAQLNEAKSLLKQQQYEQAEQLLLTLLNSGQLSAEAFYLLGYLYCQSENYSSALPHLQQALKLEANHPNYHNTLANCHAALGQLSQAIIHYKQALQFNPNDPYILFNLGDALKDQGSFEEAAQYLQQVLASHSNFLPAWVNLGNIYKDKGELKLALSYYEKAFQLSPNPDIHSRMILCYRELPGYSEQELFKALKQWEARHQLKEQTLFKNHPDPDKKLKIGYHSANLYNHSTAGVFELLFKYHSTCFELHIYSDAPFEDQVTEQLKQYNHHWHKITGLSDQNLEECILNTQIDVLVDLTGHMDRNRLKLLSKRVAPIQVTGLGFGLSTGLSTVDYIFSDRFYTPLEDIKYNAEKVWYLSSANHWIPPDYGLPLSPCPFESNGYITFGSGNTLFKLNQEVLELWSRILCQLPDSQLILKAKGLNLKSHQNDYLQYFASRGVEARQLKFQGGTNHREHLQFYQDIDIALDPFPLNGGITTCESYWMGVPVISLASGVKDSNSIFNLHHMSELLAQSKSEYLDIAIALANQKDKLRHLRKDLRNRMRHSPMCNGKEFVKEVEQAYRLMWRKWCQTLSSSEKYSS